MPIKSQAQRGFFRHMAAHPKKAKCLNVPMDVFFKFNRSDKGGKLPKKTKKRVKR